LRNREAPKCFINETDKEAGSNRFLLSSKSKNGKYNLRAVVRRSKFIKTLFFGFNPEAINKKNYKNDSIQ
jgi:hypothetical protein